MEQLLTKICKPPVKNNNIAYFENKVTSKICPNIFFYIKLKSLYDN